MSLDVRNPPPWLTTVLLAADDTEESVMGSDLHQAVISETHSMLADHAETLGAGTPSWYVSSQVTVLVMLPERTTPWRPKPDVFVVPGVPAHSRSSYDTRREGPMPAFVLEVASESTWQNDVGEKAVLYGVAGVREYIVFDPAVQFLGEPVRAWHRTGGEWVGWDPQVGGDGQLCWPSAVLGLVLRVEGLWLRFDVPQSGTLPVRRELRSRLVASQERAVREAAARQAAEERAAREAAGRQAAEERAAREAAGRQAAEARVARLEQDLRSARAAAEHPSQKPAG